MQHVDYKTISRQIAYKKGYKYQLHEDFFIQTPFRPANDIITDFIELTREGLLTVKKGYAWDGPSGPTIDTPSFMRGSLVHDVTYQLMREGLLSIAYRVLADLLLQAVCVEDDMWEVRAWWVYEGLQFAGGDAALPSRKKKVLYAPTLDDKDPYEDGYDGE